MILFCLGLASGAGLFWLVFHLKKGGFDHLFATLLQQAEKEASEKQLHREQLLKEKERAFHQQCEKTLQLNELKVEILEKKFEEKQDLLDTKFHLTLKKLSEIDKKREELDHKAAQIAVLEEHFLKKLEKLSACTQEEARKILTDEIESQVRVETLKRTQNALKEIEEDHEKQVAKILATSLNRLALSVATDHLITSVTLPNEEMKARIIGREGRNIRSFEQLTGVNILVDETPHAIVISAIDPMRKQIAKTALIDLLQDGRIHPTRIEEAVSKARDNLEKQTKEKGEEAFLKLNLPLPDPQLTQILGTLHFRYSVGQNVLAHSIEVATLCGLLASELKLDVCLAKRIGLLHDIGKALAQDHEGSHAEAGAAIALKWKESEKVANGIAAHHHETPPHTTEGILCAFANQIVNTRPLSHFESMEQYVKRLKKLEAIASEYPGVELAFALQSGKEVRVIVTPETVNDREMMHLARTLAKRIESELTYSGKIKVTVIREKKAIEYAL